MAAFPPATDQVLTFLAVLQHGSFSAAAKALNRTQSSVTYAVQKLEADLGVPVFDRSIRVPKLTPQGKALLPAARRLAREAESMQRTAEGLSQGLERKLLLAVDAVFPIARLAPLLRDFEACHPTVPLRIGVESVHATAESILDGRHMLGILGPVVDRYPDLSYVPIGGVPRVPVVAAGHPLARWPAEVPVTAFRDFPHLVLSSRSRQPRRRQFALPASAIWRVNDLAAKQQIILAGLGWGRLPLHLAQPDIAAGRLVQLRVERLQDVDWSQPLPVYVAYRRNDVLGPAAAWMRDALIGQAPAEELAETAQG